MLPEVEPELEIAIEPWLKRAAAKALRVVNPTTTRAMLAVGDQAVVSGTRFLTTALIGRVCGPTELGNYALAFTLYSLTACMQEALVSLPFTVFGNRLEGDDRRCFAGSSLSHYAMLSTTLATILALIALAWSLSGGASGLTPVLGMLGVTLPAACLIEFARRYCLARLDLKAVLSVDVTMAVCQISGLAALASLGWLSTVTAYAAIALAALITGSIWLTRTRHDFIVDRSRVMSDAAHNWKFSHWIVLSQVVFISRGALVPWLLAAILGRTAAGTYAACETIVLLANPLLLAAHSVLSPMTSRAFASGGVREVRHIVSHWTMVITIAVGILAAVFIVASEPLLVVFFGGTYAGHRVVLTLMALAIVVEGFGIPAIAGLWAIVQPRANLIATFSGTFTALGLAAVLSPWMGISGAAVGALIGRALTSVLMFAFFWQISRRLVNQEATS